MSRKRPMSWWPIATLVAASLALAVFALLWPQGEPQALPQPTRVPTPAQTVFASPSPQDTPTATPTPEVTPESASIAASDILRVSIAAVDLDVKVSGPTEPRETVNCKGGTVLCIDPPIPDQAAWYGTVPATESKGTVRLFGHTSDRNPQYATFNSLVAVKAGDLIVVETETGIFTYEAVEPSFVAYSAVPDSKLIWDNIPDRLVMITCNNAKKSGTVIEAWLVDAVPR